MWINISTNLYNFEINWNNNYWKELETEKPKALRER
jgi:hypothetical protein